MMPNASRTLFTETHHGHATEAAQEQDEDEGTTDETGRQHDSQGRFTSSDDESEGKGSQGGSNGSRGSGGRSGSQSGGQGGTQASKRVISRAIRVMTEIASRIEELKEKLEQQQSVLPLPEKPPPLFRPFR